MNIYIGNLSPDVTEGDIRQAFSSYGQVASATVIKDKFTNQSRGFGFVEMPIKSEALTAISEVNGNELKGRNITVNEARPKTEGGGGGGSRGGSRGGGGGRESFGRRSW